MRVAIDGPSLACFSGGVDSAFTIYRYAGKRRDHRAHAGLTALMVHGFDIPVDDAQGFGRAAERAQQMLESLNVPLVLMRTERTNDYFPIGNYRMERLWRRRSHS